MNEIALNRVIKKDQIDRISADFTNRILDGYINPLQAIATVAAIERFVKDIRGNALIKDAVREELEKYGSKSVDFQGVKFQLKAVSTRYDFTECNDPVWVSLNNNLEIAKAAIKEREDFLKALPAEGITEIDRLTGEVVEVKRPLKKSEDGYAITL